MSLTMVSGPYTRRLPNGEFVTCWLTSGGWICDRSPLGALGAINVRAGLTTLGLVALLVGGVVLARRMTAPRKPRRHRSRRHNARRIGKRTLQFDMIRGRRPEHASRALLQEGERGEQSAALYDGGGYYIGDAIASTGNLVADLQARGIVVA